MPHNTLVLAHHFPSWAFNLGRSGLNLGGMVLFGAVFSEWGPVLSNMFGHTLVHSGDSLVLPPGYSVRELILADGNGFLGIRLGVWC